MEVFFLLLNVKGRWTKDPHQSLSDRSEAILYVRPHHTLS